MDSYYANNLERRYGMDMNGDGYIGGEGYLSMLERITRRDINGDGILGRRPDVMPGHPGSMMHGRAMGYPGAMPHSGAYGNPSFGPGFGGSSYPPQYFGSHQRHRHRHY